MVIKMRLSRILETEDIKRNMVIQDQYHNEIRANSINEALTLPAELMDRRVVCYECSDNEMHPIRITLMGTIEEIRKYQPRRGITKKNEKRR